MKKSKVKIFFRRRKPLLRLLGPKIVCTSFIYYFEFLCWNSKNCWEDKRGASPLTPAGTLSWTRKPQLFHSSLWREMVCERQSVDFLWRDLELYVLRLRRGFSPNPYWAPASVYVCFWPGDVNRTKSNSIVDRIDRTQSNSILLTCVTYLCMYSSRLLR